MKDYFDGIGFENFRQFKSITYFTFDYKINGTSFKAGKLNGV